MPATVSLKNCPGFGTNFKGPFRISFNLECTQGSILSGSGKYGDARRPETINVISGICDARAPVKNGQIILNHNIGIMCHLLQSTIWQIPKIIYQGSTYVAIWIIMKNVT